MIVNVYFFLIQKYILLKHKIIEGQRRHRTSVIKCVSTHSELSQVSYTVCPCINKFRYLKLVLYVNILYLYSI